LLEAPLQQLFRRLAIFAGSFSLEASESVAGAELDELAALVDWNLVKPIGDGRFLMLETIREFARDLLEDSDEFEELRDRQLDFFLGLVLEAEPNLTGRDQRRWYDRLTQEHDNVREALAFACDRGDGERALMLSGSIWRFWWTRGYTAEAGYWYERALALAAGASIGARALAEFGAAHVAESLGDEAETRARFERAAELLLEAGETRLLISALTHLAGAYRELGDRERGRSVNEQALKLAREGRDVRGEAVVKSNIAFDFLVAGDDDNAAVTLTQALEGLRAVGDTYGIGAVLVDDAIVALRRNDAERAVSDLREALQLSSSIGDTQTLAHAFAVVASALGAHGDWHGAVTLAAACDAVCRGHRFELGSLEREMADRSTQAAREVLGDEFDEVWRTGADVDVGAAVELALTSLSH